MLTHKRITLAAGFFIFFLIALPLPLARQVKSSVSTVLKGPLSFSKGAGCFFTDLFRFRQNAEENRALKGKLAQAAAGRFEAEELRLENGRLSRLLALKPLPGQGSSPRLYARVIARSPVAWNRIFLIDKGTGEGIRPQMPVLSASALVGKIIEAGPSVSKALMITDANSRVGVLIQRSRQQGILFGTPAGECRMKYISVEADIRAGDLVETAGFGGALPKALPVGTVRKVWKEPGQIYQVAEIRPLADLSRMEEVTLLGAREAAS